MYHLVKYAMQRARRSSGVAPMTLASNFDSPTGATPQSTAARTVTVPAGNSGLFLLGVALSGGTVAYAINGGGFSSFVNGDVTSPAIGNGQNLQFRLTGAGQNAIVSLVDATTGLAVGAPFTITNT